PDLPGATVEGNLANYLTPEMAHRYIDLINGPNGQDETDAWQAAADAVTATYHLLPFGSFWDNLIVQHNFYEATLSLLGDLAMFAGGPLAKAAGEGTLLAKGLVVSAIAVEAGIGAARATQAVFAFQAGHDAEGKAYLGEALLRILGASVQRNCQVTS